MVLKGDRKPPFNKIISIAEIEITSLVRANDNITKLLKYSQKDALDNPNCIVGTKEKKEIYTQDSDGCRFYLSTFEVTAAKESQSEIHASISKVISKEAGAIKIPILTVDVVVSRSINVLSSPHGSRHKYLFQEFNDSIEGHYIGANIDGFVPIGCIEFLGGKEIILQGNTHLIYTAEYKIGEIKEYVKGMR